MRLPPITTLGETWVFITQAIVEPSLSELGTTELDRRKIDEQIVLCIDEVKTKLRKKKPLFQVFLWNKTADMWRHYLEAERAAECGE